ncbi:glycerol-3-phosphate 1-O-acyltransferase PlsY [Deinococcus soli (ex Cha et al. 2016)]|uniref:Glycerol-3-phosphate acyltransferase n=2 Tax=Deinococcus soli (ex Cha et al. 2016) TaxID=1309411 RepID=A0AAE3XBY9_9DEIO|nr:glycerol-3-phosphate 1-O-acyltransferase PlsY [Deinococcus soli (ex Cha et al. 2016)]MDR6219000.1 glycerol-3-phosphate acyltransferase PlsY [Deinococcus soli (ex Cha et al. 2016)]MDR6328797.1 glycerol-3-phosphate acyltransferase PlsY [Deinococcus soli (ex Cha et al. 2016)]MDR6751716.1 glycerol-3-phosphate acyltransferase PlsY [Deinococcus soli (ex Cha et al. 2016)]
MTGFALMLSYVLGSVPTGAWLARTRGVDIRQVGSGNTGATNVARALGPAAGIGTLLFDACKGALAVAVGYAFGADALTAALCGALAVLGHNYSPFLRFAGGKGVATTLGLLLAVNPVLGACALAAGLTVMLVTRLVSLGSVVGAVTAVLAAATLGGAPWQLPLVAALAGLLVWRHRANLVRLRAGTEPRFGERVAAA